LNLLPQPSGHSIKSASSSGSGGGSALLGFFFATAGNSSIGLNVLLFATGLGRIGLGSIYCFGSIYCLGSTYYLGSLSFYYSFLSLLSSNGYELCYEYLYD
jgi:hypothetical protein